jgi:hypothetical protein
MERRFALLLADLAAAIDGSGSHKEFDDLVRSFLIWNAADALDSLDARDALDDPKGIGALRRLHYTCPACFYDVHHPVTGDAHAPDCDLGAEGWRPTGRY